MSTRLIDLVADAGIDRREAETIIALALGVTRAHVVAHGERELAPAQADAVRTLLARRARGEPVAYLFGMREFYGRDFRVTPDTLIPRPETEILVEQALARLSEQKPLEDRANPRIFDMGTGTGAIAVTLALERPDACVCASDVSARALPVAIDNAARLGATVEFVESHWFASLAGRTFDLIVSNPPYVARGDQHLAEGDLRFEPRIALTDGSEDGLASIRAIVAGAARHLSPGGWLLFEHGYDQADACRALLLKNGFPAPISVPDLAGIPRVAGGQIR